MKSNDAICQDAQAAAHTKKGIDFSLILSRMEKQLLAGENIAACRRVVAREDLWRRLETDRQVKWARLAQLAGDVETALAVLAAISRNQPDMAEAWNDRLELLSILHRPEQAAQVLAAARAALAPEAYAGLAKKFGAPSHAEGEEDVGPSARPFEDLKRRHALLARFMDLFSGREDCFARQWANKTEQRQGYVPVRRPMEIQDLEEHLSGRKTYGIYLLKQDGAVSTAVIDVDLAKDFRNGKLVSEQRDLVKREQAYLFSRIKEISADMGLQAAIEFSGGKGFHFWFLFESPVGAALARGALQRISDAVRKDVRAFHIEVFPKQDRLSGKGLGNLVKLPLGIHRATGKRALFLGCHHRTLDAQLAFVGQLKPCPTQGLVAAEHSVESEKISVHPRWRQWADEYPELHRLEMACPPIGQVVAACRNKAAMSQREEKVLFQTVGFLPRAKTLMHYLAAFSPDYNPHMVDYRLSRLRGSPLGCRRIHSLMGFQGDLCDFRKKGEYAHPLLHLDEWQETGAVKAEKVENLSDAIESLKRAIVRVERFLR